MPAQVAIIMGSDSDLPVMQEAAKILEAFDIPFKLTIVSAHRTPRRMFDFAEKAAEAGFKVIIAGAGGAAHLPGMVASLTTLPVIGVPIQTKSLQGEDSLLSIVQMPPGVPVASMAINGSKNAGIMAAQILALYKPELALKISEYKNQMKNEVELKAKRMELVGWEKYLED